MIYFIFGIITGILLSFITVVLSFGYKKEIEKVITRTSKVLPREKGDMIVPGKDTVSFLERIIHSADDGS